MKSKFNKIIFNSWFTSILFLAFGIFLFVKPKMANSIIGYTRSGWNNYFIDGNFSNFQSIIYYRNYNFWSRNLDDY